MNLSVTFSEDPRRVLHETVSFLAADPVRNNALLTQLSEQVARTETGRFWIVRGDSSEVCAAALQSSFKHPVMLSSMSDLVVGALVNSMAANNTELPGVRADAATAAAFAGQWAERTKSPASPYRAGRQYECSELVMPRKLAAGELRVARNAERDLMVSWLRGFMSDLGDPSFDPSPMVDTELAAGRMWAWDDGGPVSVAVATPTAESVVRIKVVYTPPESRGRGYASANVAALTASVLEDGNRCTLFTELANPTANSVYQRIGYRAVQEMLRYDFGETHYPESGG